MKKLSEITWRGKESNQRHVRLYFVVKNHFRRVYTWVSLGVFEEEVTITSLTSSALRCFPISHQHTILPGSASRHGKACNWGRGCASGICSRMVIGKGRGYEWQKEHAYSQRINFLCGWRCILTGFGNALQLFMYCRFGGETSFGAGQQSVVKYNDGTLPQTTHTKRSTSSFRESTSKRKR